MLTSDSFCEVCCGKTDPNGSVLEQLTDMLYIDAKGVNMKLVK